MNIPDFQRDARLNHDSPEVSMALVMQKIRAGASRDVTDREKALVAGLQPHVRRLIYLLAPELLLDSPTNTIPYSLLLQVLPDLNDRRQVYQHEMLSIRFATAQEFVDMTREERSLLRLVSFADIMDWPRTIQHFPLYNPQPRPFQLGPGQYQEPDHPDDDQEEVGFGENLDLSYDLTLALQELKGAALDLRGVLHLAGADGIIPLFSLFFSVNRFWCRHFVMDTEDLEDLISEKRSFRNFSAKLAGCFDRLTLCPPRSLSRETKDQMVFPGNSLFTVLENINTSVVLSFHGWDSLDLSDLDTVGIPPPPMILTGQNIVIAVDCDRVFPERLLHHYADAASRNVSIFNANKNPELIPQYFSGPFDHVTVHAMESLIDLEIDNARQLSSIKSLHIDAGFVFLDKLSFLDDFPFLEELRVYMSDMADADLVLDERFPDVFLGLRSRLPQLKKINFLFHENFRAHFEDDLSPHDEVHGVLQAMSKSPLKPDTLEVSILSALVDNEELS